MGTLIINYQRELEFAIRSALAAGEVLAPMYASLERIDNPPANISTEADKKSQEVILTLLNQQFPDDRLCGEEENISRFQFPADAARCWIVDPIDGTRGFVDKSGEYCVMVGFVDAGEVLVGVVLEPSARRLTFAAKGMGCFVVPYEPAMTATYDMPSLMKQATRVHVTNTAGWTDAVMSASRSQKPDGQERLLKGFGAAKLVLTYSAGIKLAQVARGETDAYLGDYLTLRDWDVCAGHILVTEAGGIVTSVDGEPIVYRGDGKSLNGRGIFSSNGKLHASALNVLKSGGYTF